MNGPEFAPLRSAPDWDSLRLEEALWRETHPVATYNDALTELARLPDARRATLTAAWDGTPSELVRLVAEALAEGPASNWRTLADISDAPAADLLLGMIDTEAPTLLYGAPSVGKGTTGAWLAVELQALGLRPGIFDTERRPREWSRRVSGLGGDRAGVSYIDPADLGPAYAGLPIWDAIEALRTAVAEARIDVLFVDSILPALNVDERRLSSDPTVPWTYESALRSLGIPVVSFAHPPKGQPEGEPFGSFAWVAAHRLTWLGVRLPGDAHRVRWRSRKANERGAVPGLLLGFDYAAGSLAGAVRADDDNSTRDWILGALYPDPLTIAELIGREAEEQGEYLTAETTERAKARMGKALYRMKNEGWVSKAGKSGQAVRWGLAELKNPGATP